MAVLVIVGMPVLQATLQNYRFRSATDWVMGDIRQTRSLAVPQGKFLSYHGTSTGTYRIERSTIASVLSGPGMVRPGGDSTHATPGNQTLYFV